MSDLQTRWTAARVDYPDLRDLEVIAIGYAGHPAPYCANDCWYGYGRTGDGLRDQVRGILGFSDNPAYTTAVDYLYDLLPPCQHAGMCKPSDQLTMPDED